MIPGALTPSTAPAPTRGCPGDRPSSTGSSHLPNIPARPHWKRQRRERRGPRKRRKSCGPCGEKRYWRPCC
ncbi:hypothetical protein DPMN_104505 [Dreissena polymorpha]|uniref:Uncharacterized protein n=1 Tax=Dreissena polymorpha TaxID=45954 RepID=A0A9D4K323_DREPO|nr:hypothetical protein DPMN_104505 [Dreissena polymorpha]